MKNTLWVLLFLVFLLPVSQASQEDSILGEWLTGDGKSRVDIYQCEKKYCGKITWLKEPVYAADDDQGMAGKTKVDRENKDERLRSRSLIGLKMLKDFEYEGGNKWEEGSIYDPRDGKTYSSIMTLKNSNLLHVRGYIGFSFIGKTTVWTRFK